MTLRPSTRTWPRPTASGTLAPGRRPWGPGPCAVREAHVFVIATPGTTKKWRSTCRRTTCQRTRTRRRRRRAPNEPRSGWRGKRATAPECGCACLMSRASSRCTGPQRAQAGRIGLPDLVYGEPPEDPGRWVGGGGGCALGVCCPFSSHYFSVSLHRTRTPTLPTRRL